MKNESSLDEVVSLEQHFIDTLKPFLAVEPVANGTGYHTRLSILSRLTLRKERGWPYLYI